ncbi:MAG: hypothetical protein ACP5E5_06495 [Acidobacteriaceae bacterium]
MKPPVIKLALACTLALASLGCTHAYYPPPPPPPPPPSVAPNIVQIAESNGFSMGRRDGARAAQLGQLFHARHTRTFRLTPGYNPQMGPYNVYRHAFRRAYLKGYREGYYH